MDDLVFEKLKQEIADLKKEVASIKNVQDHDIKRVCRALRIFKKQRDQDYKELTELIKDVYTSAYQRIADLFDIISPIEDKIFPRAKDARRQVKRIVGPKNLFATKKWDKKGG